MIQPLRSIPITGTSTLSGRRRRPVRLASVRRSNPACSFPALGFHKGCLYHRFKGVPGPAFGPFFSLRKFDDLVKKVLKVEKMGRLRKMSTGKARESRGMRRTLAYAAMTRGEAQRSIRTFYEAVKFAGSTRKKTCDRQVSASPKLPLGFYSFSYFFL